MSHSTRLRKPRGRPATSSRLSNWTKSMTACAPTPWSMRWGSPTASPQCRPRSQQCAKRTRHMRGARTVQRCTKPSLPDQGAHRSGALYAHRFVGDDRLGRTHHLRRLAQDRTSIPATRASILVAVGDLLDPGANTRPEHLRRALHRAGSRRLVFNGTARRLARQRANVSPALYFLVLALRRANRGSAAGYRSLRNLLASAAHGQRRALARLAIAHATPARPPSQRRLAPARLAQGEWRTGGYHTRLSHPATLAGVRAFRHYREHRGGQKHHRPRSALPNPGTRRDRDHQ